MFAPEGSDRRKDSTAIKAVLRTFFGRNQVHIVIVPGRDRTVVGGEVALALVVGADQGIGLQTAAKAGRHPQRSRSEA